MKDVKVWFLRFYFVEDEELSKSLDKKVMYLKIEDTLIRSPEDLKNTKWESMITIPFILTDKIAEFINPYTSLFLRVYPVEDETLSKLFNKKVRYLLADVCIITSPEDLKNIVWKNVFAIPYVFGDEIVKQLEEKSKWA